jgi:ubiquinone/menaquinone biosynthesis C-methylase UbiE
MPAQHPAHHSREPPPATPTGQQAALLQHEHRVEHYDKIAPRYDRARPSYPQEAIQWALGSAPLRVLEVGAGTGKLTRRLVELGHSVVAVEPARGMREVLLDSVEGVEVLAGRAEDLPLPAQSVDAVVCAQAYYLFDHRAANAEFARVLRPQGVVCLVFNSTDTSVPWAEEMMRALLAAEDGESSRITFARERARLAESFPVVDEREFKHGLDINLSEFRELVLVRPRISALPPERRDAAVGQLAELLRTRVPERFTYPYVTTVYRARGGE